jgi:hypothetical protein
MTEVDNYSVKMMIRPPLTPIKQEAFANTMFNRYQYTWDGLCLSCWWIYCKLREEWGIS